MKENICTIKTRIASLLEELEVAEKTEKRGWKTAAKIARKITLELEKDFKEFRRTSVAAAKV